MNKEMKEAIMVFITIPLLTLFIYLFALFATAPLEWSYQHWNLYWGQNP